MPLRNQEFQIYFRITDIFLIRKGIMPVRKQTKKDLHGFATLQVLGIRRNLLIPESVSMKAETSENAGAV